MQKEKGDMRLAAEREEVNDEPLSPFGTLCLKLPHSPLVPVMLENNRLPEIVSLLAAAMLGAQCSLLHVKIVSAQVYSHTRAMYRANPLGEFLYQKREMRSLLRLFQ